MNEHHIFCECDECMGDECMSDTDDCIRITIVLTPEQSEWVYDQGGSVTGTIQRLIEQAMYQ